jgi:serine/threonine-protein kinase
MKIAQKVGPFRVISHIEKGGMGDVYLAKHEEKGRLVAIKVLPEEFLNDRKRSQYLEREVKIARKLRHPNVVDIYGLHRENGIGYLIMEYLDGGSLRKHIKARDLGPAGILEIMLKICDGLHYIHNHRFEGDRFHSIIHRDIKPENILLSKNGRLKVADFGLSLSEGGWSFRKRKSRAGTPLYMSPEQIRGKPLDIRTDIYSLGLVLYELLTGQLPYKAENREMYMKMTVSKKVSPSPPTYLDTEIPKEFDAITLKALKKKPEERYQAVTEMILDLRRLTPGLMTDDMAQEFQFMYDVTVARSSGATSEVSPSGIEVETSPCDADDTTPATPAAEPENECVDEALVEEPISDDGESDNAGTQPDDAERLRQELLQLHREMIYSEDPEKARAIRTAEPERSEATQDASVSEDQSGEPCEETAQEPVEEAASEIIAEAERNKSDATPEPEMSEANEETPEPEALEVTAEPSAEAEEPEGEFLPGVGSEDNSMSRESEDSEPAPAALGENSGIVDGELIAESSGNGELIHPEEAEDLGGDGAGAAISGEAESGVPLENTDGPEEEDTAPAEEEVEPASRQAANPSGGNGAVDEPELEPVHAGDESAPASFGSLDVEEIEDFIFIGRKKG